MSGADEINKFMEMTTGAPASGSMDNTELNDEEIQRMIENIRNQIIFKQSYGSSNRTATMTNKQQKARKKSKAAKQARKKNRK